MHFTVKLLGKFKIIFMVFLLSFTISVSAQNKYRITYDYNTDKISYLLLNENYNVIDTLESPKIKRNSNVEIKLSHVNPFAVKVLTDVKEEKLTESGQGFNFSSLLGGINSFSGNSLNLNTSSLPDNTMFSGSSSARGTAEKTVGDFEDFNTTLTNVSALRNTFISNLLNPNLDKTEIINNLINTANSARDVRLPNAEDNFYMYLAQLEKTIKSSKFELEHNVNKLKYDLEKEIDSTDTKSRGELVARKVTATQLQDLITGLNTTSLKSIESLEELRSLYTSLESSNFEQIYDYELEADQVNIELKFIQSDLLKNFAENVKEDVIKIRKIKLKSKGGFKINTSVAMTLNNFSSNSNDFFISEDGEVGADKNDFFVPNLSTMINFYPYLNENFSVGGSFGLSIPISGNENVNGINFLLGPSLFFGNKSRLALSGGIAFGSVTQLTNGIEIGDVTQFGNIENFTKTGYDFGYYFGISFSLFNIN